jgi:hypothetical protein
MGNHRRRKTSLDTHTHTHTHTHTPTPTTNYANINNAIQILYATIKAKESQTQCRCPCHQLTDLLKLNVHTRHLTLINVGNQHGNHQDNTIPPWILSCTCNTTQCDCLANLRPDIVYIQGVAYEQNGPLIPTPDPTIQTIEFTFTHDRFLEPSHTNKRRQIQPISRRNKSTRLEY